MISSLISIIIPLFNKEENIARTIQSVQNQIYPNWELLIVDDGSTDDSAEVVKTYLDDQRIKYIYKHNGGVSSARNRGVAAARGEWVVFLDADDYFLPDALQILYELIVKHDTLVSTAAFMQKQGYQETKYCNGDSERVVSNNFRAWFFRDIFPRTGAALFHCSILKTHLFDEKLSRYEDAKSLFEIFRKHRIAYSPRCVMVYSLDNLGLSKRSSDIQKDFIFHLDFECKSFWEKICLYELLLQGFSSYPEHEASLVNKHQKYRWIGYVMPLLMFYRRIRNKLHSYYASYS